MSRKRFMVQINGYYRRKLRKIIEQDKAEAEDTTVDRTNLEKLINISNFLEYTQLLLLIFCLSYFMGMFWYSMVELFEDP